MEIWTIRQKAKSPTMRQLYSSIAALLPALSAGCTIGYSSIVLPQLEEPQSIIPLNSTTVSSWIASITIIACIMFSFASGYSQDRYGRKKTHNMMCFLFTVGWITIALSYSIETLLCGRFLAGAAIGIQSQLSSVYVAETTSPDTRHNYLAAVANLVVFGVFLVHFLGTYMHWKIVAWICASFTVMSGVMMLRLPDTPNWYISRGKISNGRRAFKWYRGSADEAQNELAKMLLAAQDSESESNEDGFRGKIAWIFSNLKKREFLMPLVITICLVLLLQASCDALMAYYSINILKNVLRDDFDPYVVMLTIDAMRLITIMFSSSFIMRYCGRRTALLLSGMLVFLSLGGMALFIYLQKNYYIPDSYFGFTLAFLIIHTLSVPIGILILPWLLIGELFPTNLKGLGTGICTFTGGSAAFIVAKTGPQLFESFGIPVTFAFYAFLVFILTVVIAILLPETKGKTLQEIQEYFKGHNITTKELCKIRNTEELSLK